jgi:spermidine synthase
VKPHYLPSARQTRPWLLLALCALLLPVEAGAQGVVYDVRSQYQRITVVDTPGGYRQLLFDTELEGADAIQSEMNLANPDELTLPYARYMIAALPAAERQQHILVVGLGGASIQRFLRKLLPDATIETAELDPEVRNVAAKYFFFKEDAQQVVHLGDGRAFIERSKEKYDLIMLDAFSATSIPYQLTTREFLEAVRDRVAEGGVVAANLWNSDASYWDMVKTYATVFPVWHVLNCAGAGNNILVAKPSKAGFSVRAWADRAAAFEKSRPTGLDLPQLILSGDDSQAIPERARVLTDKRSGGQDGTRPRSRHDLVCPGSQP